MRYLRVASLLVIAVLWCSGSAPASEIYKWTDENGVLHIVTSLADVPERYRDQITTLEKDAAPSTTPEPANGSAPAEEQSQPAVDEPELLRFEIPYKNEGSTRRVIIPVKFNDRVTAPMALDTGAPGTLIGVDLAVKLGVFSRDKGTLFTVAGGIGGQQLAILTILESMSVGGARNDFVPTIVTAGFSSEFDGLIGMDFLANYTISIDTRKQVVVFQETAPLPGSRGGHDEIWWRRTFEEFRVERDRWKEIAKSGKHRFGRGDSAFLEFQERESKRLLLRLDQYASDNAVPRHWRQARFARE